MPGKRPSKFALKTSFARSVSFGNARKAVRCAVVIPSCGESVLLPETLDSLLECDTGFLADTAVLVVVNNPPDADPDLLDDNRKTLDVLKNEYFRQGCRTSVAAAVIDATLPGIKGGVGEARRIGVDSALELLDPAKDPFIVSLDADTLVEKNYLAEIFRFFDERDPGTAGAVIAYAHQRGAGPDEDRAIAVYELYMRHYVEGLRISRSPYAFHTIGSAMAFTAADYVRAGGMKIRRGGEDFYFLQALRKCGEIGQIHGTTVHPSARVSGRNPFGTGPAVKAIADGKKRECHNIEIFLLLKKLLETSQKLFTLGLDAENFLGAVPPPASDFLRENKFSDAWPKILRNTPDGRGKREHAFLSWFDAFRTLKLIHFCEIRNPAKFARVDVMEGWRQLLEAEGKTSSFAALPELLDFARKK